MLLKDVDLRCGTHDFLLRPVTPSPCVPGTRNVTATGNILGCGSAYLALIASVSRSISPGISFNRPWSAACSARTGPAPGRRTASVARVRLRPVPPRWPASVRSGWPGCRSPPSSARSASFFCKPAVRSSVRAWSACRQRRGQLRVQRQQRVLHLWRMAPCRSPPPGHLSISPTFMRENLPSLMKPPAVMTSSWRRWLSPPITTSRAWATMAGVGSRWSGHDPGRDPVQPLAGRVDQTSARSSRRHICTSRWFRWASTTSSRPSAEAWSKTTGRTSCGVRVRQPLAARRPASLQGRQAGRRVRFGPADAVGLAGSGAAGRPVPGRPPRPSGCSRA